MVARGAGRTAEQVYGREVRRLRVRLGISQEELGFRAGVHRTYISQIERGIKSPTLGMMMRLAKALSTKAAKMVAAVEQATG